MADLQKTSIHIIAVKGGSEAHNLRTKELSYVKKELTPLNEKISHDTIANRLQTIKAKYIATVGQQMQKKAAPIREGVIVIHKNTELFELELLAIELKKRFGIDAFQIYLHADEGHNDLATGEWKSNYHAHMVFDWTDKETGKSIRLNRQDMSEMQTMCANILNMERGVSSEKKHLNAMQWKALKTQEELAKGAAALEQLKTENEKIKPKENVSKAISKTAEKYYDLLGITKNDKEKDALKTEIIALKEENKTLGRKNEFDNHLLQDTIRELNKEKAWKKDIMEKYEYVKSEIQRLKNLYEPNINQNKNKQQRFEM